jgi:two-component system, sensor histidine kinase PhcS
MALPPQQIQQAFEKHDRDETVDNFKVASILGMVLVPSFAFLDYSVYPGRADEFLAVRFVCSALIAAFLSLLLTSFGRKYYRYFAVTLVLLPGSAISYMIARSAGAASPYYAGLNLVLLMTGFVLRWTFRDSLIAVSLVFAEYLAACLWHGPFAIKGEVLGNFFFLGGTGIIVATGNYFFSQFRYREFALRYELKESEQQLADSNRKVSKQNEVLESTIAQLKDAEAQLVHNEKLASLGRMSAGIIHEINNPLNYATTGLFTLRNKGKYLAPDQQEEYQDILKDVEEGIKRVRTIVSDLRMFTHPDTESRDQVEVPEVVAAALRFMSNEWKDKVRIEQKLAEHQSVWANKNMLIHVLVNLLQNSLDALRTKSFVGEQPTIWIEGRLEPGKSILVVRDNGAGIEAEHLDKIFDPFYTTKDVGEGMGLGLSICYRIVRECEGQISVRTEPGKFCEFALEFPAKGQQ